MGLEDEAGELGDFGFFVFLGEGFALFEFAAGKDVGEGGVHALDVCFGEPLLQADDEAGAEPAVAVEIFEEVQISGSGIPRRIKEAGRKQVLEI